MLKSSFVGVNGEKQESYSSYSNVSMGDPEKYSAQAGVLSFRGGPFRQNAAAGTVTVQDEELSIIRGIRTGRLGDNTGFGFGAQPNIIKWYKNIREMMNISDDYKNVTAMKEVIVPSADGKIYFYDLDSQNYSREPINVGVPMSVSASVNPYGYPLLYVGQSEETVQDGKAKYTVNAGLRIFNLIDQKLLAFKTSLNTVAEGKTHGATSAVVDTDSDTVIYTDRNGMLYTVGMNTMFNLDQASIYVSPSDVEYGYVTKLKNATQGIPASVSVYGNYAYFGDLAGSLQCVDMNTMQTVWAKDMTDSVVSSVAIEENEDGVYLYVSTVINKTQKSRNIAMLKLDALTGEKIWETTTEYRGKFESKTAKLGMYAGAMASPLVGEGEISDLVVFNINRLEIEKNTNSAVIYALDKMTGEVVWFEPLDAESVSSPIAVYDSTGKSYIVVGDEAGTLRLMDGFSGMTLSAINLNSAIQASPAAYGNTVVVGTSGGMLYFVGIK